MLTAAIIATVVFITCYLLTIVTTSVGYHRGLAHGAVTIREPWRKLLEQGGVWLNGIDAKTWVVMHRLHHAHSDTPDDPHSPRNAPRHVRGPLAFATMFWQQLAGYQRVADGLRSGDPQLTAIGRDLEMSWPMKRSNTWLPILPHVVIALAIAGVGLALGSFVGGLLVGAAYFAGMMSHVVQGAVINYFGHAHGGRNFDIADDSRNNHFAAWLVLGEGFQNNHHRHASSARFSYRAHEVDMGWGVCLLLEKLGVLTINRATLAARAPRKHRVRAPVATRTTAAAPVAR